MKKILLFLSLIFLLSFFVNAGKEDYTIYYGTLTLSDGTTTSNVAAGQTLSATIGGVASGSKVITTAGEYKLIVTCTLSSASCEDAAITFSLSVPSGYDSVTAITSQTYSRANNEKYTSLNLAFTGTPTTTAAAAEEEGPGGGGGAMAAPAQPTPEALTKVDITTVSDIIASLPEGWTNVDIYQVGTPKTETVTETIAKGIENALTHATKEKAISVLQTIQNKIKAGEVSKVGVTKTLNTYKVTNKDTGQSVYRSKITLIFTAPNDMKNVKIVEIVPSFIVDSIDGIDFPGIKPEILQTNPIFQWTFDSVEKDETKTLDYIIKKKVDKIESVTVAGAEVIPGVKEPIITKGVIGIMIIVVIILIGLFIYYQFIRKKERKKRGKRNKKVR